MTAQLAQLVIFLAIDLGFWYRFAAPALQRAEAPERVRQIVQASTILTAVGLVSTGIYFLIGIDAPLILFVVGLPNLAWLLVVFSGWPRYRRLTRFVAWWQSRRGSS